MFKLRITGDLGFEFWQDIPEYEGLYQVSTYGRIKSVDRIVKHNNAKGFVIRKGKILSPHKTPEGYMFCGLCKEGKVAHKKIHRMVAITFLPIPQFILDAFHSNETKRIEVNHKDENKENNAIDNLEWCTSRYNANYGNHIRKIVEKHSMPIISTSKSGTIREYSSAAEAERITGINTANINACCKNRRKTAGGYYWQYKKRES